MNTLTLNIPMQNTPHPLHTETFDDVREAWSRYAGLRVLGIPPSHVSIALPNDGTEPSITLYKDGEDELPPNFPATEAAMGAKLRKYTDVMTLLKKAISGITGRSCQDCIGKSEMRDDYALSIQIASADYSAHRKELLELSRSLSRDMGIERIPFYPVTFVHDHPLASQSDAGMAFEFPLSPALFKIKSETLTSYVNKSRVPSGRVAM